MTKKNCRIISTSKKVRILKKNIVKLRVTRSKERRVKNEERGKPLRLNKIL
jgi:hypothetical protein